MNVHLIQTVVGIIGNIISLGLFFSPAPTVIRILKNKLVEEFHPYIYLAGIFNCCLWVLYGSPAVQPDQTLVWTINAAGLVLYSIYIAIYGYFAPKRDKVLVILLVLVEGLAMAAISIPTLVLVHRTSMKVNIIGKLALVFNIALYASPLTVAFKVYQTKSIEYLPFWPCIANLGNGIIWTTYALLQWDQNIVISNGVGICFAIFQVGLLLYYGGCSCFTGKKDEKGAITAAEVQLQNKMSV